MSYRVRVRLDQTCKDSGWLDGCTYSTREEACAAATAMVERSGWHVAEVFDLAAQTDPVYLYKYPIFQAWGRCLCRRKLLLVRVEPDPATKYQGAEWLDAYNRGLSDAEEGRGLYYAGAFCDAYLAGAKSETVEGMRPAR